MTSLRELNEVMYKDAGVVVPIRLEDERSSKSMGTDRYDIVGGDRDYGTQDRLSWPIPECGRRVPAVKPMP